MSIESPADAYEAYTDAQDRAMERARASSTCIDCVHSTMPPADALDNLADWVCGTMRSNLAPTPSTYRTMDALCDDVRAVCRRTVPDFCHCGFFREFVTGDEAVGQCEGFEPC